MAASVAFSTTTPTSSRRRSANNAATAIAAMAAEVSEAPMDMSEFLNVEVGLLAVDKKYVMNCN